LDALHTILFYVFAGLTLFALAGVALLVDPGRRGAAVALFGTGTGGMLVALSAGFAGLVTMLSYLAAAALLARAWGVEPYRSQRDLAQQAAGPVMAMLLAALIYVVLRADFTVGAYPGGGFGSAALGLLLFGRDALAVDAAGLVLLCALAGAAAFRISRR
jgi:NADH:ubiquinone oxidoreductase subunit 6 (subunit J)